ncbi:hypothetical protein BJX62DRAFT_215583 [Aspergillus germanicus]
MPPPQTLPPRVTLPVLIWAEGGCSNNGTRFEPFLTNIASHGFIVLALGPPNGTGYIFQCAMDDAVTWIKKQDRAKSSRYRRVDSSRIAAAGQSCGGLLAYTQRDNDAVSFLGIFNSGLLGDTPEARENLPEGMIIEEPDIIHEVRKPVFWWLGGEGDVAYPAVCIDCPTSPVSEIRALFADEEQGTADYRNLTGVPKWIGNYPVGHSGTYREPDGGEFGVAAVKWLKWVLKGDIAASKFFRTGGAERAGWIETKSWGLERMGWYI